MVGDTGPSYIQVTSRTQPRRSPALPRSQAHDISYVNKFSPLNPKQPSLDQESPFYNHFIVPVTLTPKDREPVTTQAYIDSGDTSIHMSHRFAIKNDFPRYKKAVPEGVQYFNRQLEEVTEITRF
jgi:hypothetical protein